MDGELLVRLRDVHKTYDVTTAPVRALRGVDNVEDRLF